MRSTSYIELDFNALRHNVSVIHKIIGANTKLSFVVKGNAYGHGIEEYVPLALELGATHFSVFGPDEAHRVKSVVGDRADIMIMGMMYEATIKWAIQHDIEFYIFSLERLQTTIRYAEKLNKKAKIHIEVETGMNRTGFEDSDLEKALEIVKNHDLLDLYGIATHFAGAENIANSTRIKNQHARYNQIKERVKKMDLRPKYFHAACSAASLRYPEAMNDLVRIGILQYGFFPNQETLIQYMTAKSISDYPLKRVLSWKSEVMAIKHVGAGEFIGYGTSYFTNRDTQIAIVPVGYAYGYSRSLSNQGKVLIHGKRLSVIGTVNMNMIAVDIGELNGDVYIGDEVMMIGRQGNSEISVSSFSEFSDQVNYELLTRLPSSIPRKIKR